MGLPITVARNNYMSKFYQSIGENPYQANLTKLFGLPLIKILWKEVFVHTEQYQAWKTKVTYRESLIAKFLSKVEKKTRFKILY